MASLIVVCTREPGERRDLAADLRRCAAALAPDNITPHPPVIQQHGGLGIAVVNPVPGIAVRDEGVCLGRIFGPPGEWSTTGAPAPDGNFAIMRHDRRTVEVLTDILATRQLWYVHTPELFAASTTQRALIMLLRSFDLDEETVAWMVASGHLACRSWDGRLRLLPGDARLTLDRERWTVQIHERPADRSVPGVSDAEHIDRLEQAILATCARLDLPPDQWVLPLSGGLDSRMLLIGLARADQRPRCVTWGLRASLLDAENDAFIARELAGRYGCQHEYCCTDEACESIETAMRRFIATSEGQTRDFNGYTDGLATWKAFFEGGVAGVIRGDEPGLGYFTCYDSEEQILRRQQLTLVSDYPEGHPIHRLGLAGQHLGARRERRESENLASWSIRLNEESYSPSTIAPLNTIKAAYVEIVNPLQSRLVTEAARQLPDHLRRGRASLTAIVRRTGPDIPLAKRGALGTTPAFYADEGGMRAMTAALSADAAELVFSRPALDVVLEGLRAALPVPPHHGSPKRWIKAAVPKRVVEKVRPVWPLRLGPRELAFRTYLAVRAASMLAGDAEVLGGPGSDRHPAGGCADG